MMDARCQGHLRHMLTGQSLLKRVLGRITSTGVQQVEESDAIEIATFRLASDLRHVEIVGGKLTLSQSQETVLDEQTVIKTVIPLTAIKHVIPNQEGLGKDYKSLKIVTGSEIFEMIASTEEDYAAWYEGLSFLVGNAQSNGQGAQPAQAAESPRAKMKRLEEENANLRKDNVAMADAIKRKDATINNLLQHDTMRGQRSDACKGNIALELETNQAQRQIAALISQNKSLKHLVKQKQQTLNHLLEVLRSSTIDDISESESEAEDDEDNREELQRAFSALRSAVCGQRNKSESTKLVAEAQAASQDRNAAARAIQEMMFRPPPRMMGGGRNNGTDAQPEPAPSSTPSVRSSKNAPQNTAMAQGQTDTSRLTDALEELEVELKKLDEKKRLVQRLAMSAAG